MGNYTTTFSKESILQDLDTAGHPNPYKFWLDLEHGYFYTAGSRITLFADENRWAIVFEKSGYGNRSMNIGLEVTYFGNCLIDLEKVGMLDYWCNTQFLSLVHDFSEIEDKAEDSFELISKTASFITIRNQKLPIEQDIEKYRSKGISINEFDNPNNLIDYVAFTRYMSELYPLVFQATKEELYKYLPQDLPKLMNIETWHHKYYYQEDAISFFGDKPSTYETFKMIADVLVAQDTTLWQPTLLPNNDWRNWPKAGDL